jgi:hypothetical protein
MSKKQETKDHKDEADKLVKNIKRQPRHFGKNVCKSA